MALKIKEDISNSIVYKTIPVNIGIPHQPNGLPIGSPVYSYMNLQPISIHYLEHLTIMLIMVDVDFGE